MQSMRSEGLYHDSSHSAAADNAQDMAMSVAGAPTEVVNVAEISATTMSGPRAVLGKPRQYRQGRPNTESEQISKSRGRSRSITPIL